VGDAAQSAGVGVERPVATVGMDLGVDQIEHELRAQAAGQLRDYGAAWV
jgi:hypothetical protein